ncbi:hypothetical protein [Planctomycetes bacterium CA13]
MCSDACKNRKRLLTQSLWLGGVLSFYVVFAGCDSPRTPVIENNDALLNDSVRNVTHAQSSPRDYLGAIFSRYRVAGSYRDDGRVRLKFEKEGKPSSEVAPLSVWFDPSIVYLKAYDTRLWSDRNGISAWIVDPSTHNFDSQVLRGPAVERRPKLKVLLTDLILIERIAAGLAGPPPQLEWLFADEPMKGLFEPENQFAFGLQTNIEGQPCQAIVVTSGTDKYTFWIDTQFGLVRQVDLPPVVIPNEPNQRPKTMQLSLELSGATFDPPTMSPRAESLPPKPKFVTRFVPLPPAPPISTLGSKVRGIEAMTTTVAKDSPEKPAVLAMVYVANEQSSLVSAMVLQDWYRKFPAALQTKVLPIALMEEGIADMPAETQNMLRESVTIASVIDNRNEIARSLALGPGSLVLMEMDGRVAWIQPLLTPQSLPALGTVVADVLNGVDIPGRIASQSKSDANAYKRVIATEYTKVVEMGLLKTQH